MRDRVCLNKMARDECLLSQFPCAYLCRFQLLLPWAQSCPRGIDTAAQTHSASHARLRNRRKNVSARRRCHSQAGLADGLGSPLRQFQGGELRPVEVGEARPRVAAVTSIKVNASFACPCPCGCHRRATWSEIVADATGRRFFFGSSPRWLGAGHVKNRSPISDYYSVYRRGGCRCARGVWAKNPGESLGAISRHSFWFVRWTSSSRGDDFVRPFRDIQKLFGQEIVLSYFCAKALIGDKHLGTHSFRLVSTAATNTVSSSCSMEWMWKMLRIIRADISVFDGFNEPWRYPLYYITSHLISECSRHIWQQLGQRPVQKGFVDLLHGYCLGQDRYIQSFARPEIFYLIIYWFHQKSFYISVSK